MDWQDYVTQAQQVTEDPHDQWAWALRERKQNPDQGLANAEHYLYAKWNAGQGPLEAYRMLVSPFAYYAGKKIGLLGGRSEANLGQLQAGLLGAWDGIFDE